MELTELQLAQVKRTRILIVDDLPENLQVLGSTLREYGFQIAFTTSGKQALMIAQQKKPHLILLDMSMPEMDGLTVCRKLKDNPETKTIPVIFLTARTETDSIMRALSLGAVDYVVKPFVTNDLIERIMSRLGINKIFDVSPEEQDKYNMAEVSTMLELEYLPLWHEVKRGMFIDDIVRFADKLRSLGEKNHVKLLKDYAEDLYAAANSIQIEKMNSILNQFPLIPQKILRTAGPSQNT